MCLNLVTAVRLKLRNIAGGPTSPLGIQSMQYWEGVISVTGESTTPTYNKPHAGGNFGFIHRDGSLRPGELSLVPTEEVALR